MALKQKLNSHSSIFRLIYTTLDTFSCVVVQLALLAHRTSAAKAATCGRIVTVYAVVHFLLPVVLLCLWRENIWKPARISPYEPVGKHKDGQVYYHFDSIPQIEVRGRFLVDGIRRVKSCHLGALYSPHSKHLNLVGPGSSRSMCFVSFLHILQ